MKGTKLFYITIPVVLLFLTIACSQQPDINVSEILGKSEEFLEQSVKIGTTSSSFDGKKDIKFRLMMEEHPTENEAIILFNQILDSFEKYSNKSDIWNFYNGYFDIKSYDNGIIYKATKLAGEDLQVSPSK